MRLPSELLSPDSSYGYLEPLLLTGRSSWKMRRVLRIPQTLLVRWIPSVQGAPSL